MKTLDQLYFPVEMLFSQRHYTKDEGKLKFDGKWSGLVRSLNSRDICCACAVSRTEELSWRIMADRRRHKKRVQVSPLHPNVLFAPKLFPVCFK